MKVLKDGLMVGLEEEDEDAGDGADDGRLFPTDGWEESAGLLYTSLGAQDMTVWSSYFSFGRISPSLVAARLDSEVGVSSISRNLI